MIFYDPRNMQIDAKIFLIIVALVMAGCSSNAPQPSEISSSPTEQLLAQADMLKQQGNLDGAIAQIERALRLEPRNARAWHQLAALHLAKGDLNKAEQFARRSNQFAASNKELIEANQKVLDEVQRLREKQSG